MINKILGRKWTTIPHGSKYISLDISSWGLYEVIATFSVCNGAIKIDKKASENHTQESGTAIEKPFYLMTLLHTVHQHTPAVIQVHTNQNCHPSYIKTVWVLNPMTSNWCSTERGTRAYGARKRIKWTHDERCWTDLHRICYMWFMSVRTAITYQPTIIRIIPCVYRTNTNDKLRYIQTNHLFLCTIYACVGVHSRYFTVVRKKLEVSH